MTVVKDEEKRGGLVQAFDNAIVEPLRESRSEMRKVVWPPREEIIRLTIIVVVLSATLSVMLFFTDAIFTWLLLQLQNFAAARA
jgi:preprotein translocase subunit SecE